MKKNRRRTPLYGDVLLCAPFGKDAEILRHIAVSEGFGVIRCGSLTDLAGRFSDVTDFLLLTEEAIVSTSSKEVETTLNRQEPWSDVPIILFASAGATASGRTTGFVSKLGTGANISILERPVRIPTILSALRTAKRARMRQHEVQRLLSQEKQSAAALRAARDELEQRVQERTSELSRTNRRLIEEAKERKRAERDLSNLSAKVLQIQDEERRRFARDLHDGIGQTLAGALMALAQAKSSAEPLPSTCESNLQEVENLLQLGIREVRTVSHLLHPPLLDESGLMSAIRWYAEGFSKRSKIGVELALDEQRRRLSQEIETAVFRIVQEALTNVHRHSGAKSVVIKTKCTNEELALHIKDDGRGIPARALPTSSGTPKGVGLASMRERCGLLGGTFKVESSGRGTLISALIPLSESRTTSTEQKCLELPKSDTADADFKAMLGKHAQRKNRETPRKG